MELHILSAQAATEFIPLKPTYALRLHSPLTYQIFSLINSQAYKHIAEYIIASRSELSKNNTIDAVLTEFNQYKNDIQTLLIHSPKGKHLSPAVAMALNEIFNLGNNNNTLISNFPDYDERVYSAIVEYAHSHECNLF